jgi:hypothetical protein
MVRTKTRAKSNYDESLLMETKLTCADIAKSTLKRFDVFSCSKCDLFRNDRHIASLHKQKKRQEEWGVIYQCTRPVHLPAIKVRAVSSAWLAAKYPSNPTPTPTPTSPQTVAPADAPVVVTPSSPARDTVSVATKEYKKRKREEEFDAMKSELEEVKRQKRELEIRFKKVNSNCWCHHVPKKQGEPCLDRDVLRTQLRLDIELAATKRLKNKHKKTKAKIVLSMLQTGELFGV